MEFFNRSTVVQQVKRFIMQHEDGDSDLWDVYGNEFIQAKLSKFNPLEWEKLRSDLQSWTSSQKFILAEAIVMNDAQFENVDVAALYGYIFTIVDTGTAWDMIENLKLLNGSRALTFDLLTAVKQRIREVKGQFTEHQYITNYDYYEVMVDQLLNALNDKA